MSPYDTLAWGFIAVAVLLGFLTYPSPAGKKLLRLAVGCALIYFVSVAVITWLELSPQ